MVRRCNGCSNRSSGVTHTNSYIFHLSGPTLGDSSFNEVETISTFADTRAAGRLWN
jgi:hypothetical protein